MIQEFTGISYIKSGSYETEPEFWNANPVPVNLNRKSGSIPVSGQIIQFRSYPRGGPTMFLGINNQK
jgi:hypothetical protein